MFILRSANHINIPTEPSLYNIAKQLGKKRDTEIVKKCKQPYRISILKSKHIKLHSLPSKTSSSLLKLQKSAIPNPR